MIGADPAARTHEIRDLHARNSVPFGFGDCDSEEGRAALDRFGLRREDGPVVALYSGLVLVNPSNAEVGQALGADVRPAERTYDVVIVGAVAGLAAAVYVASEGLRTAAEATYQASLAIAQRLAAADPSNAQAQRDLAIVLKRVRGIGGEASPSQ